VYRRILYWTLFGFWWAILEIVVVLMMSFVVVPLVDLFFNDSAYYDEYVVSFLDFPSTISQKYASYWGTTKEFAYSIFLGA
jgi:hypothetical protein